MSFVLEKERYKRLWQISFWQREKIKDTKVIVVGAGALGNEVLKLLTLIGIGKMILIDFDKVKLTDLSRSFLFREEDEGRYKVEVIKERLLSINKDVNIEAYPVDIRYIGGGLFKGVDFVFGCVDNRLARVYINKYCQIFKKTYIDGGIGVNIGKVDVFLKDKACYECTLSQEDYSIISQRYLCPQANETPISLPTTPMMASIIAGYMVEELVKLLFGVGKRKRQSFCFIFDSPADDFYITFYSKKKNCWAHLEIEEIIQLDIDFEKVNFHQIKDRILQSRFNIKKIELDRELVKCAFCKVCNKEYDYKGDFFTLSEKRCKKCNNLLSFYLSHNLDDFLNFSPNQLNLPEGFLIFATTKRQTQIVFLGVCPRACVSP